MKNRHKKHLTIGKMAIILLGVFSFPGYAQTLKLPKYEPDIVDKPEKKTTVSESYEIMPVFPGGEKGLSTFIYEHIKYPAEAIKNKEEGKVIVLFVISKTGKVEKSEIIRGGISPNLNNEVLRVVNMLPDFKPGEQNGKK